MSPVETPVSNQTSASTPVKKSGWVTGLVVALVVVGVGGGFLIYHFLWAGVTKDVTEVTNTIGIMSNANTDATVNTSGNLNTNSGASVPTGSEKVTWVTPVKLGDLKLLGTNQGLVSSETPPAYYQVGTFTSGKYIDQKVVMVLYFSEGPQISPTVEYFAVSGNTGVILAKPSSDNAVTAYYTYEQVIKWYTDRKLTIDQSSTLDGLHAPATMVGPKPHQTLVRDTLPKGLFNAKGLAIAFTDPTYGKVYTNADPSKVPNAADPVFRSPAINERNGFYLKMADGMIAVYELKYDFISYNTPTGYLGNGTGVLQATWLDGSSNKENYNISLRTGCGSVNYADVVPSTEISINRDLKTVGKTETGDALYGYTKTDTQALKDWYNTSYQVYGDAKKVSYADFVADHPIVFFVDSFNRLVRLTNGKYQIAAECGKPVIYLYPTTTTNVDVKLQPQGGFSYSEPVYNNGWQVTATPNSELTERATGKVYPYLFWEGRGGIYTSPDKGRVVAQADVRTYLVTTLATLGLNQKETADFIEFWEPKMQGSPYNMISFLGNQSMNEIAPMQVTPQPDTVIRILMDFHPLSKKNYGHTTNISHSGENGIHSC